MRLSTSVATVAARTQATVVVAMRLVRMAPPPWLSDRYHDSDRKVVGLRQHAIRIGHADAVVADRKVRRQDGVRRTRLCRNRRRRCADRAVRRADRDQDYAV